MPVDVERDEPADEADAAEPLARRRLVARRGGGERVDAGHGQQRDPREEAEAELLERVGEDDGVEERVRHAAEERRVADGMRPDPAGRRARPATDAERRGRWRARRGAIGRGGDERHGDGGQRRDDADEQRGRPQAEEEPGGGEERVEQRASTTASPRAASTARARPPMASDGGEQSGALVVSWRAPRRKAGAVARRKLPRSAPRRRIRLAAGVEAGEHGEERRRARSAGGRRARRRRSA